MDLVTLTSRIEAYDPKLSPDNRADELEMHRDIVLATGIGSMNPPYDATFLRSLDAAMSLVLEGWGCFVDTRDGRTCLAECAQRKGLEYYDATAATPALALCAACLRARVAEPTDG